MEVAEYCIEINKQTKLNSENEEIKTLFELFKNDFKEFLEKVNEPNTQLKYSPIFSKFNSASENFLFAKKKSVLSNAFNPSLYN